MAYDLVPINREAYQEISKIDPQINEAMANQFFLMTQDAKGKPKLTMKKAGLFYKLDELYRGKHDLETGPVDEKEYDYVKKMLGIKGDNMCVIAKSKLSIDFGNKVKTWTAYGTVTPSNAKGTAFPLELAETRAEIRVIKKATGCGFAIQGEDDETPESMSVDLINNARRQMFALFKALGYADRTKRLELCSEILGCQMDTTEGLTFEQVEIINNYLNKCMDRKNRDSELTVMIGHEELEYIHTALDEHLNKYGVNSEAVINKWRTDNNINVELVNLTLEQANSLISYMEKVIKKKEIEAKAKEETKLKSEGVPEEKFTGPTQSQMKKLFAIVKNTSLGVEDELKKWISAFLGRKIDSFKAENKQVTKDEIALCIGKLEEMEQNKEGIFEEKIIEAEIVTPTTEETVTKVGEQMKQALTPSTDIVDDFFKEMDEEVGF